MGKTLVKADRAAESVGNRILERLGIVGIESIEPVLLAALIQQDPLLLIGLERWNDLSRLNESFDEVQRRSLRGRRKSRRREGSFPSE